MQDWRRLGILFGLYLVILAIATVHGVGPIEAVTKIQLNTADAQNVSNKTFDSTNTFNGTIGTGTYSGPQTFSALTANSIPLLNSSKQLTSTANPTNGQLLIGSTGSVPVLGSITGTANRVTVTPGAGTITLTGPQDLHTGASPTFNALTLSTPLTMGNGGVGLAGTPTNGQLLIGNGSGYTLATLTGTANRVTVTNGAGSITLNGPQDLHSAASPTFAGATMTGPLVVRNQLDLNHVSGGQIKFPSNQNASTDVNVLDDYEEGTWTPSLGGTATYTSQSGRYVKIGRVIHLWGRLIVNTIGTGSTNTISPIPFPSASGEFIHRPGSAWYLSLASSVVQLVPMIDSGFSSIIFHAATAASASLSQSVAIFGNGTSVEFYLCYTTDN